MITLPISEGVTVDCYRANFVTDTIQTSVGDVPFEWTVDFTIPAVIEAIQNFVAGTPNEVESTGAGWIVPVGERMVEITDADFMCQKLNFRWIAGSEYSGDCAVDFTFTAESTVGDVITALGSVL